MISNEFLKIFQTKILNDNFIREFLEQNKLIKSKLLSISINFRSLFKNQFLTSSKSNLLMKIIDVSLIM